MATGFQPKATVGTGDYSYGKWFSHDRTFLHRAFYEFHDNQVWLDLYSERRERIGGGEDCDRTESYVKKSVVWIKYEIVMAMLNIHDIIQE